MKEPLFPRRYQQVEKNELPARHGITSSVPVFFKKEASFGVWGLHQIKMHDCRKLLASIDANGYDPYQEGNGKSRGDSDLLGS